MDQQDFISLNWDDHSKTFISQISKEMEQDILKDVTLACADGHCIRAHRLILSIYSTYFQQILKQCTNPEPTILLPDVQIEDLKILLKFMYSGDAHVNEDNLVNILKTATRLQIKGLEDDISTVQEGPPMKKLKLDSDYDDLAQSVNTVSDHNVEYLPFHQETNPALPYMQWLMMNNLHQIQSPNPTMSNFPGAFPLLSPPQNIGMEDIGTVNDHYECKICHRFFKSKPTLNSHMKHNHKPMKKPIFCCEESFMTRWELRLHKTMHNVEKGNNIEFRQPLEKNESVLVNESDSEGELVIDLK